MVNHAFALWNSINISVLQHFNAKWENYRSGKIIPSYFSGAMELPDPFLPGAVSLLDQLDKRMMVMLRDGKTLIGYLRTIDQFANLVLHETIERIHVDNCYGDIPRGIFLIRGENVVLAGEIDENRPNTLKQVSLEEIITMQAEKQELKRQFEETRHRILEGSGRTGSGQGKNTADNPLLVDDAY